MSWSAAPTTRKRLQRQMAPQMPAASLSDVFADTAWDGAAVGFVLSRLPAGRGPVLWVQDRISRKESGVPYMPGLPGMELMRVSVNRPIDALWAMEEGLRCAALRAVVGEIWGEPSVLSFTATKRLALRAEASGVPCMLMRRAAGTHLSAARDRWRVSSRPSARHAHDPHAPGTPRWQVELFRSRHTQPGTWVIGDERTENSVDHPAELRDGALDARHVGPARSTAR